VAEKAYFLKKSNEPFTKTEEFHWLNETQRRLFTGKERTAVWGEKGEDLRGEKSEKNRGNAKKGGS